MQYKTRAFIIRRKNLSDASRLIILLTEKKGKIKAVAKSVKKSSSHLAGHLEQFCFSRVKINQNLDKLAILTGAEIIRGFPFLRKDAQKTHFAFYCAEVFDAFLPEGEEHKKAFVLAWQVFNFLDRRPINDYLISFFIFNLLAVLGFAPELKTCAVCGEKLDAKNLFWSDARGGVVCGEKKEIGDLKISADLIKTLRLILSNNIKVIDALPSNQKLANDLAKIAKKYLQYQLGEELKSERFLI